MFTKTMRPTILQQDHVAKLGFVYYIRDNIFHILPLRAKYRDK
jgi:hypothetical protein